MKNFCDLSVRGLDELIDYQDYPVKAAELGTINRRSLGIRFYWSAHYLAKLMDLMMIHRHGMTLHGLSEAFQYYLTEGI